LAVRLIKDQLRTVGVPDLKAVSDQTGISLFRLRDLRDEVLNMRYGPVVFYRHICPICRSGFDEERRYRTHMRQAKCIPPPPGSIEYQPT